MSEEEYYNRLERASEEEPATVPFQSYCDLEKKYEDLDKEFIEFKQDVFNLVIDEKFGELVEYLKSKGVF